MNNNGSTSISPSKARGFAPSRRGLLLGQLQLSTTVKVKNKVKSTTTSSDRNSAVLKEVRARVRRAHSSDNPNKSSLKWTQSLLVDLQAGQFHSTRNWLVQLRFDSAARRLAVEQLAQSYQQTYGIYTGSGDNGGCDSPIMQAVQDWTRKEPDNKDAHLLLGVFWATTAWDTLQLHQLHLPAATNKITSFEEAEEVEALFHTFTQQLQTAEQALLQSMELDPTDPLVYAYLLTATRKLSKLRAVLDQFQQNAKDPLDITVHQAMLHRLSPTRGGSLAEVFHFAKSVTVKAHPQPPTGHPLWSLMAQAHLMIWKELVVPNHNNAHSNTHNNNKHNHNVDQYWKEPRVGKEIVKTYRKYRGHSSNSNSTTNTTTTISTISTTTIPTNQQRNQEDICRNLFAFVLYKCKAYTEVYPEFCHIGDYPLSEPWNSCCCCTDNGNNHHNYQNDNNNTAGQWFYQLARDKVLKRHEAKKRVEATPRSFWESSALDAEFVYNPDASASSLGNSSNYNYIGN